MKISKLNNEIQEFWHNLVSSDIVKIVVDVCTVAMDLLGDIIDNLGTIGTLFTSFIGAAGVFTFKKTGGGRDKKVFPRSNQNMPPNRLAERCAR